MLHSKEPHPACPGPAAVQTPPRRLIVPPGAVDTHGHVIGLPPAFPFVAERSYTPPAAPIDAYLSMLNAVGMTYGVLTQVSVHGTDNRCLLGALEQNADRLRGVAVVPLDLPKDEYRRMARAGIVGIRLNVLFGGGIGLEKLEAYDALAQEFGWHVQLLIDGAALMATAARLRKLRSKVIVDHIGYVNASQGERDPGFQALVSLVKDGLWVRLSGAYRLSNPPYADTIPLAHALLTAAPERCVWASDWPHVANWGHMMRVGDLLDLLVDWAPDEETRKKILVTNPTAFYGFPPVKDQTPF